jgi:hypothetical protein
MCTGVELALIGASTAATVYSVDQQKAAGRQQKRAFEAEQRKAEVQNVRAVRQQVRQARLAQAQMSNIAGQTGGMFGSGLAGGQASTQSQLAGNLNYMSNIAAENTAISNAQIAASNNMVNAAIGQQVGQMAGTIFGQMYSPTATTAFDDMAGPLGSGSAGRQRTITGGR